MGSFYCMPMTVDLGSVAEQSDRKVLLASSETK
jgi:hypothetical protein